MANYFFSDNFYDILTLAALGWRGGKNRIYRRDVV